MSSDWDLGSDAPVGDENRIVEQFIFPGLAYTTLENDDCIISLDKTVVKNPLSSSYSDSSCDLDLPDICIPHYSAVNCMDMYTINGALVLVTGSNDNKVRLHKIWTGELLNTINTHVDTIKCTQFQKSTGLLITADASGLVMIWEPGSYTKCKYRLELCDLEWVKWLNDKSPWLVVGMSRNGIQVWDIKAQNYSIHASSKCLAGYHVPFTTVIKNDELTLVYGCPDGKIIMYNMLSSRKSVYGPFANNGKSGAVFQLATSPNQNLIYATFDEIQGILAMKSDDPNYNFWIHEKSRDVFLWFHSIIPLHTIMIALGDSERENTSWSVLTVWDIATQRLINSRYFPIKLNKCCLLCSNKICCVGETGILMVLDTPSLTILKSYRNGNDLPYLLSYFENYNIVVSCDSECDINIFFLK